MKFVDREREMARLLRLSAAGRGGLVVVWGRRRIGKSELLKEWCRRVEGGLYTVADRSAASVQRQNFASSLIERLPGFDAVVYPTWKALFDALARQAKALMERPLPAHFPSDAVRVLFLSSVAKGVPSKVDGVVIVDAEEVCAER